MCVCFTLSQNVGETTKKPLSKQKEKRTNMGKMGQICKTSDRGKKFRAENREEKSNQDKRDINRKKKI